MGPVVDLFYSDALGRRRGWIVGMQILMSATLLLCMPIDFAAELRLFTLLIMVVNIFGATQDVAIDALACGVLREDERGLANGLMFAGAYIGQALGGAGVLFLASLVGFNATFFCVAATQFTAYMAMLNLVIWYSATWQGFCIEAWGYPVTLGIDALAGLACLPLLPWMSRDRDA